MYSTILKLCVELNIKLNTNLRINQQAQEKEKQKKCDLNYLVSYEIQCLFTLVEAIYVEIDG